MDFLTLERFRLPEPHIALRGVAAAHGLTNVFNPSLAKHHGRPAIAFRAESQPNQKPFRAYVQDQKSSDDSDLIDLSTIAEQFGIRKVADPKLVILNDELYATFNTGNVRESFNDVYLQRIRPSVGPPQRCILHSRRPVEKNWGFYDLSDGILRAIYSLAPLTVLRLQAGELGTADDLLFVPETTSAMPDRFPRLHLGSQPVMLADTKLLVAANQQRPIRGIPRKLYFGRLVEIDLARAHPARISQRLMIHSWYSMLPQRKRHNPGLFSATYFSGLIHEQGKLTLSYGVNDVDAGFAQVDARTAWGR